MLGDHRFGFEADETVRMRGSRVRRGISRVSATIELARRFDVFHFNGGQTFIPGSLPFTVDAALLRRLGKRVFVTYLGSDVRPTGDAREDRLKRRRAEALAGRVDGAFCVNPDLLPLVPGAEFVPYASVSPAGITPRPPEPHPGPLRVVHAPSDRAIKGTEHVIAAVDALAGEFDVELDVVEHVPHDEALRRCAAADVVVDQLNIGWYGTLAVECMALAKPVIAHVDAGDLARVPASMAAELPIVRATRDDLVDRLREVAVADRALLGRRGRAFVERWHDPLDIARRTIARYRGEAASFWVDSD